MKYLIAISLVGSFILYLLARTSVLAVTIEGPNLLGPFWGWPLNTPSSIVAELLLWVFPLAGMVALLFLTWGGFKYLTAQGDQKAITSAQQTIIGAVVGLLIVFVSYWVVQILGTVLGIDIVSSLVKPVYAQVNIGDKFLLKPNAPGNVGAGQLYPSGLGTLISNLVPALITVAGLAFLIYLIIGAFRYVTSGGDEKAVGDAKKTITSAFIGLLIVFVSYWIIKILEVITGVEIVS